ncbi:SdrD B-like domain-containing protein [Cohnella terricola]|uniref:SLH domain-containing protein n=1 Tax=Cohnella terricola TaxID=1289167 RepID=A0A559J5V3_9BACL|nr:SdrD B-like domain-containing protein [Cohnella terricola]TVX95206.1 hypothetical protein FPZ45_24010 [Cohnella terricola]
MKKIAVLLLALILCAQTFIPGTKTFASSVNGLVISLSTNEPVVDSGEEFNYIINYSASSTIGNYTNPSILLLVPAGVTYTGRTDSSITTSTVTSGTDGSTLVTFTFRNGVLPPGTAGRLVVKGKFENYVTPDGTQATTKAVFTATDNGSPVSMDSNEVMVTSQGSAHWGIEIKKIVPTVDPFKGSAVHYEIVVKPDSGNGKGLLDIKDVVVTATLDGGAEFILADNGGTYIPANNTVSWEIGDDLQTEMSFKLVVNYPASMTATEATTDVEMNYTPLGKTPATIDSSVTHGFETAPIHAGTTFNVYTNEPERSPGQTIKLYLSGLSNKANVALDSGVLEIMTPTHTKSGIPLGLQLQTVKTALFSGVSTYDLYYMLEEDPGVWMLWSNTSASTATTYDATALGNIKGIQVRFGTLPIDWSQGSNFEFTYNLASDFVVAMDSRENIRSSAKFTNPFAGEIKTSSDNSETSIVADRPLLELQNTVSKTSAAPAESVTYTLSVTNRPQLSSANLFNPVIYTILPANLEYVPGSWSITKPAGTPTDPIFTAEPLPSGETKLTWSWDDSNPGGLLIGENVKIQFAAKIKPGTAAQIITNTFGVQSPNYLNDVNYSNPERVDGTYRVEAESSITVTASAALQSRMWVKGELDTSWSETMGSTTPGGQSLYRLDIQNIGNVAMKELAIVNPFPRIGDSTVLNGSVSRGSQWGPILTRVVNAPAYVKVYYSTTPGITMHPTTGVDNGVWTESPPADLTSVQAIKLVFDSNYVINPLDTTTLEWAMRAPVGAPTGGETAWNSFAYRVKYDSGQWMLPAEPNKVGMSLQSSPKASIGDFVWLDLNENGLFDDIETGMNGVTVELYDAIGTKLAETVTANDFSGMPGAYLFPNLDPGSYRVVFTGSQYEAVNSDLITLGAGDNYLNLDVGVVLKKGKIGGFVWIDANENGLQDAGESGLNGVRVRLYGGSGGLLATTTTATNSGRSGHYEFDKLNPGNYIVEFVLPSAGYEFTVQNADGNPTIDSAVDPATGRTSVLSLAQGEENFTINAGIIQLPSVSVAGRVWLDANRNGIQDTNEEGINGIVVELYDEHDQKIDQTTTADQSGVKGKYAFDDLLHGKYYVKFIYPTATHQPTLKHEGADRTIDSDMNADGTSDLLTLLPGETATVDAGIIQLPSVSVAGRVWLDANRNGIQDTNEEGINGIVVELYDEHGQKIDQTTTADQSGVKGKYAFDDLLHGKYYVKFIYPTATHQPTLKHEGADRTIDSDMNADGTSDLLTLLPGETATVDAGLSIKSVPQQGGSTPPTPLTPPTPPTPEPEQNPNPSKEIFKAIVDRYSFLANLKARIAQANQSNERIELTDLQGHWAQNTIQTFVQLGLVKGYSNGKFAPNEEITRGEFVAILSRMIDFTGSSQQTAVFNDISNHWAKQDIVKLSGAGIVQGYSNGSFMPNQGISREEAVVVISRLINFDALDKVAANEQLSDLSAAGAYARNEVQTAAEVGIVKGKPGGIFDPKGKITRAEAVTLLLNVLRLHPEAKKLLESSGLF